MTEIEQLIDANRSYAEKFIDTNVPSPPSRRVAVITCMDSRIDPIALFHVQVGDLHIIRNAGGRVTEDTIRSLVVSEQMLGTKEVLVLQHTRCGMMTVDNSELQARVAERLGLEAGNLAAQVDFLTFSDLEQSLKEDVYKLKASPLIPEDIHIRGAVYDVNTGSVILVS